MPGNKTSFWCNGVLGIKGNMKVANPSKSIDRGTYQLTIIKYTTCINMSCEICIKKCNTGGQFYISKRIIAGIASGKISKNGQQTFRAIQPWLQFLPISCAN